MHLLTAKLSALKGQEGFPSLGEYFQESPSWLCTSLSSQAADCEEALTGSPVAVSGLEETIRLAQDSPQYVFPGVRSQR